MEIRQNQGKLYPMKMAVGAILWHCTDFNKDIKNGSKTLKSTPADDEYRHRFCPTGESSWYKWQKDKSTGKKTYRNKTNIPKWIHDIIRPIFEELSGDELLSKCLHGKTQNANEALNNIIWTKCPKSVFVERIVLEIGVNSAVSEFNEGRSWCT